MGVPHIGSNNIAVHCDTKVCPKQYVLRSREILGNTELVFKKYLTTYAVDAVDASQPLACRTLPKPKLHRNLNTPREHKVDLSYSPEPKNPFSYFMTLDAVFWALCLFVYRCRNKAL